MGTIKHTNNTHTMGLTKKAKILLGGLAGALLLVVVIVPLVVLSGRQSTDAEGRERLRNIDLSLQRSAQKMLDLVEEVEAQASRRVARDVNMMELRDLEQSVSQLTRSLSDFAEMLNESGFSNIIARFQQDLQKYEQILTEIQDNSLKINSKILEKIKTQEKSFTDDETDLFKIENISRAQSVIAGPVIMAMGLASNRTKELLKAEEDADNIYDLYEALPVNQDNGTVIEIPTNDTTTAVITDISTEEIKTEKSAAEDPITEITDDDTDDGTTVEPDDRVEKTSADQEDSQEDHSIDRSLESDEDSVFETPIQTPDLSDVD